MIVRAIDQQATDAGSSHFAEGDLLLAGHWLPVATRHQRETDRHYRQPPDRSGSFTRSIKDAAVLRTRACIRTFTVLISFPGRQMVIRCVRY